MVLPTKPETQTLINTKAAAIKVAVLNLLHSLLVDRCLRRPTQTPVFLIDKPMSQGDDGRLGTVGHAQLTEDPTHIVAHRAFREKQLRRNVCIRLSIRKQAQDLALARAQ